MALKRLRMVSPSTARHLFGATVAPVVDHASNIWMPACGTTAMGSLNRVRRVGVRVFKVILSGIGRDKLNYGRDNATEMELWADEILLEG